MARLALITVVILSVTCQRKAAAATPYAPRQSSPGVQQPQPPQQQYHYQQLQQQQYQYQQPQQPQQQYQYQQPQQPQQQYHYQQPQPLQQQYQYQQPQPPQQQYQHQQPQIRPLTEVLSSNMLLQIADLVGGRPSAMPPTLTEDLSRRSPFNPLAARQAIAMTDSQQVGVRGKVDDNVLTNTNKNTSCARAIVVCCKPPSERVRYGCFEALGCPGFFLNVNPCSKAVIRQLVH